MELHDLKPRSGSKKDRKRVGRGAGSGSGKTAGRGTKGEGARAGSGGKLYHQGGNLPFFRRLPFKRGFTVPFRTEWAEINLRDLAAFEDGATVGPAELAEAGLIPNDEFSIVLLAQGYAPKDLKVRVHRASAPAREKLESAGGSLELLPMDVVEKSKYVTVQVAKLNAFDADSVVGPEEMAQAELISAPSVKVKVHGRGELVHAIIVRAHAFSHRARASIMRAGGKIELIQDS